MPDRKHAHRSPLDKDVVILALSSCRSTMKGLIILSKPFIRTTEPCFEIYFPAFGGKFLNMLLMSPSNILVFLPAFEERLSVDSPLHSNFFELPSNTSITRLPTF